MKKTPYVLAFLAFFLLMNVSCKKKSKSDTDPNNSSNNSNTSTSPPSCVLTSYGYTSTGFYINDTYTYNTDGSVNTRVDVDTYGTITDTYSYDTYGNLTKKAQSSSSYTTYEYTSGKISKFTDYVSSAISDYNLVDYQTGKTVVKQYNTSNQLTQMTEYSFSNNNTTSTKNTYYTPSTGAITSTFEFEYSNFDSNYSSDYFRQKTDKSILQPYQNNPKNITTTQIVYSSPGVVSQTNTSSTSSVLTYNTSGAITKNVNSYTSSSSGSSTFTQTYNYSNCN
ncbi:MAG TPA: hypothetical protein VNW06_11970 [Cytophagaceae bacterium]|nr:hypothetical protein [Cytophagaceae bacterium]